MSRSLPESEWPEDHPPALVVTGPTASGKSRLAVEIAEAFDGTVINADSMQVYRELAVLTARPGAAELARAPHRLYGVLSGSERCSAGRWRAMALGEIGRSLAAGRLPILVGGTGLYLRALERGLASIPPIPPEVRAAAEARFAELGGEAFRADLAERDPEDAAPLRPSDRQRLVRAWEVLEATGRPLSAWQAGEAQMAAPYRFLTLVCLPERSVLYAACDARVRAMVAQGALAEVEALRALDLDPALPVMKALGVAEFGRHLEGRLALEDAIRLVQTKTRRYAKRQTTWLRTQTLPERPDALVITEQFSESLRLRIFNKIRRFLLTG